MRRRLNAVACGLVEAAIGNVPGPLGRRLRHAYYRRRLAHLGKGTVIDCGVRIVNPEWVRIGDNCWIDNYVIILAGPADRNRGAYLRKGEGREGEVVIGDNFHVAPFVVLQGHGGLLIGNDGTIASGSKVYSLSHHYRNSADPSDRTVYKFSSMSPPGEQSMISATVRIGNNCAVGLNSVLLPGTELENGVWIGCGSVVSGRVAADTVHSAPAPIVSRPIERGAADAVVHKLQHRA
jgi:galactoside O-acetyltransferase